MAVPLTNITFNHIRTAVISTGGTVAATDIKFSVLVAQSNFADFDPTYLAGATDKTGITKVGQFRNYPRQRWYNVQKQQNFTKNNCSGSGAGSSVTYTVNAGAYYSYVSQVAADNLAQDDINANGQTYANTYGTCTYSSEYRKDYFTRNDCGSGYNGNSIEVEASDNQFSGYASLAAANYDRDAWMQNYANANAGCTQIIFYSEASTQWVQRNDCGAGYDGGWWEVPATAGQFTSGTSVADANTQRNAWLTGAGGQAVANANGSCTQVIYYSTYIRASIQRNNCGAGYTGQYEVVTREAGAFSSVVSVAAANAARDADMQTEANNNAGCNPVLFYSEYRSEAVQRNNCGAGYTGQYVVVTRNAGTFSSTVDVATANAARDADMQTEANNDAGCTLDCTMPSKPSIVIDYIGVVGGYNQFTLTVTNHNGTDTKTLDYRRGNSYNVGDSPCSGSEISGTFSNNVLMFNESLTRDADGCYYRRIRVGFSNSCGYTWSDIEIYMIP